MIYLLNLVESLKKKLEAHRKQHLILIHSLENIWEPHQRELKKSNKN
jgi:hypothetical protein